MIRNRTYDWFEKINSQPGRLPIADPIMAQAPATVPAVPPAPNGNPLEDLPYPSPGDRIRSDDFRKLAQRLQLIANTFQLAGELFGHNYGEAKLALAGQQYQLQRVMTIFGTEIADMRDTSFDDRKIINVVPTGLGERGVMLVLTEAVDTRRIMPNLVGLTYQNAVETIRTILGDAALAGSPMNAQDFVGTTLTDIVSE